MDRTVCEHGKPTGIYCSECEADLFKRIEQLQELNRILHNDCVGWKDQNQQLHSKIEMLKVYMARIRSMADSDDGTFVEISITAEKALKGESDEKI
jgi:hypothetical protein